MEHHEIYRAIHCDADLGGIAQFEMIRHRCDRALFGFEDANGDAGLVRQQCAAPVARAEGRDRRQRDQRRVEGQDRAVGGEIIGRRTGRRRHQHAVRHQFGQAHATVDGNLQLGRLVGLAKEGNFVERARLYDPALRIDRAHVQGMDDRAFSGRNAVCEAILAELVHEEADRAAIHPVNRLLRTEEAMQRLQHEAVAAESHDHIRLVRVDIAIEA